MATQTTHFDMVKQQSPERVSVGLLNDNFDIIDGVMFANQEKSEQLADDYNASETYNTGDYVRRENYLYKCNTDNTTGTWDDTKWDRVKVMNEITQGGGGGSSTLAGLNDVNISSPTDGQALVYDVTTGKWVNRAGGGGSSTFAGLNDVNVQGVQNGDIARYNSTTGKWTDSSDLSDLELAVADLQASVLSITDGHTILDSNGTAMAQEDDLQFASGYVEDDDVNGKTVYIEMIRISQANYDTLKANGQLKTGAKYFIYDAQPVAVNASNLPYSSTKSTKEAIDGKGDNGYYPSLNITNNQGGTESNKAVLITCGNIGQCEMAWVCQNASSEELTVTLPSNWDFYRNGCYLARDVNNGAHVSVWSSSNGKVATYAHIGTMAVGHTYKLVLPAYKTT